MMCAHASAWCTAAAGLSPAVQHLTTRGAGSSVAPSVVPSVPPGRVDPPHATARQWRDACTAPVPHSVSHTRERSCCTCIVSQVKNKRCSDCATGRLLSPPCCRTVQPTWVVSVVTSTRMHEGVALALVATQLSGYQVRSSAVCSNELCVCDMRRHVSTPLTCNTPRISPTKTTVCDKLHPGLAPAQATARC